MAEKTTETFKFEQAMADLETVVNKLEKGDMPLDDALDAFDALNALDILNALTFCCFDAAP